MSDEIKAFLSFVLKWFVIGSLVLITCFMIWGLSSCSGTRKVVKSSSSIDSTVTVKTETKKDSSIQQSIVSKTEIVEDNDIQSKDDYIEETTYIYGKDSNNIPTVTKTVKRTGTKTTKDNSKKKTNIDVKDTVSYNQKESKNENIEKEVKQKTNNKKSDSEFELSGGKLFIGIGAVLGICIVIYIIYRKAKRKVKETITKPFDKDDPMNDFMNI